jgi:hypothetical protein
MTSGPVLNRADYGSTKPGKYIKAWNLLEESYFRMSTSFHNCLLATGRACQTITFKEIKSLVTMKAPQFLLLVAPLVSLVHAYWLSDIKRKS